MSREHLYKAKRVNWMEFPKEEWWVEGFYVQLPKISLGATIVAGGDLCAEDVADYIIVNKSKQHSNFSNAYPLEVVECEQYEVDPETVCQYTGLTDKAGKKIFEGDIIKYENKNFIMKYIEGFATFDLRSPDNTNVAPRITTNTTPRMEVIGNIFDNPEFLEGGVEE